MFGGHDILQPPATWLTSLQPFGLTADAMTLLVDVDLNLVGVRVIKSQSTCMRLSHPTVAGCCCSSSERRRNA